jgi:hypothetical protein
MHHTNRIYTRAGSCIWRFRRRSRTTYSHTHIQVTFISHILHIILHLHDRVLKSFLTISYSFIISSHFILASTSSFPFDLNHLILLHAFYSFLTYLSDSHSRLCIQLMEFAIKCGDSRVVPFVRVCSHTWMPMNRHIQTSQEQHPAPRFGSRDIIFPESFYPRHSA